MKSSLTFYGGLDTVGGVHIIAGSRESALLFDLGISHNGLIPAPFIHLNSPVQPIENHEIRQYLLGGMAPPLLDIYDPEFIQGITNADLQQIWKGKTFPTFKHIHIFITHIHQDHMALLPFLKEGMTVFMHEDSLSAYKALVSSGYYKGTKANIVTFRDGEELDFGDFQVKAIEVDHNVPGTTGFILKIGEEKIAYTADWRTCGYHPDRITNFIKQCQEEGVDVLLTETTRLNKQSLFSANRDVTETEVVKKFETILADRTGLTYLLALPLHLERLADFLAVVKKAGKVMVMEENIARYWHDAVHEGISVLKNHPSTGDHETIKVLIKNHGQANALPYDSITIDEIVESRDRYVVNLNFRSLAYLLELERMKRDEKPSIFVHADSPSNQLVLDQWLKELTIPYINIGNGGHARPEDITDLIQQIQPKVVIPVHGRATSLLDSVGVSKYYPTYGETISLMKLLNKEKPVENIHS